MSRLKHTVGILETTALTHNVIRLVLERPEGFQFSAGKAVELTINQPEFITDAAPFTLTGLPTQDTLEIIFKVYPAHRGMTLGLSKLRSGDVLLIGDSWNSFTYQSPGVFIAGGSGITSFVALLRQLQATHQLNGNQLIFANKTTRDMLLQDELSDLLGDKFINILSEERTHQHHYGRIDAGFLKEHITNFNRLFYLCGPDRFSLDIGDHLLHLGAKKSALVTEY